MKEYEYAAMVIDEYFSHYFSMLICHENFKNDYSVESRKKSLQEFYDDFSSIHSDFKRLPFNSVNNDDNVRSNEHKLFLAERMRWRLKKENKFNEFMNEFKEVVKKEKLNINLEECAKRYKDKINQQDITTLQDEILIYPYLLLQIRNAEQN